MPKNKKANVGAMVTLAVGVGVAILVLIFVSSLSGQTYQLSEPGINNIAPDTPVTGETFTAVYNVTNTLAKRDIISGSLKVYNATSPYLAVGLDNFSVSYTDGTIKLITKAPYNNSGLAVNYSYGSVAIEDSVKGAVVSAFGAQQTTANYLPIVVLAVVIMIVLGYVIGFANVGGKGGGMGGAL